ncbi:MAG: hypothetical protein WBW31_22755 [Candidatus Sulfotelmatobacter sp.]
MRYDFAQTDMISDEGGNPMGRNGNGTNYAAVNRSEVPQGRKGKHRKAVADILADLPKLTAQQAIKVPLSSLNGEKMQNLRSALNRVTREKNIPVVTSSDKKFLYVWRADQSKNTQAAE